MSTPDSLPGMTLDALAAEEKAARSGQRMTALTIGILVGIAIWSATHGGNFVITIGLLAVALIVGRSGTKHAQRVSAIRDEVRRRDTQH
jgi:uncharacterized membrane protein